MASEDDWRLLRGQENYLKGVTLRWKKYTRYSPQWDHDHCSFCWAKFMDADYPDALREGYATLNDYHWICKECYEDFKDMFEWKVETERTEAEPDI